MDTELTDSQYIDSIGGTSAVAKMCDRTKGAVSQWRKNGIPDAQYKYLKLLNKRSKRNKRKET
jgi:hypothetical protein